MGKEPDNHLCSGIGAVTARIETSGLKILERPGASLPPSGERVGVRGCRCPQLLNEAELYQYGDTAGDR